jgi:DNA (cytosine-5)-methyltransferase 1
MGKPLQGNMFDELIIDNFAGGGGASLAMEQATNRPVDIAINHDPEAICMHTANHPCTKHYIQDVWSIDPLKVTMGRKVGLCWFSPDCKHFSKAKGGKPVSKNIRDLAWVVVRWAKMVRPRVIALENVEEFSTWGPLVDNKPCPERKGSTFYRWIKSLERFGYRVQWEILSACDYGAPTIRKRLFLIARCDDQPIVWPDPTHGPDLQPYRTAAECIDWSISCPSIFGRKRPLAENTLKRIARGIYRFVLESPACALAIPHIQRQFLESPARALAIPHIQRQFGKSVGSSIKEPLGTITAGGSGKTALVTSHLVKLRGTCKDGQDLRHPLPTVTAGGLHTGEVRAFLIKYYGTAVGQSLNNPIHTVTTKDRLGLVTIAGEKYQITDISMRMLTPRELYRAQGFPDSYIIDPLFCNSNTGKTKPLTKTVQVRMCGNSVSPYPAKALVEANYTQHLKSQIAV